MEEQKPILQNNTSKNSSKSISSKQKNDTIYVVNKYNSMGYPVRQGGVTYYGYGLGDTMDVIVIKK